MRHRPDHRHARKSRANIQVTLRAKNAKGTDAKELFTIVVGDTIALTPPMGWNSWNCWGGTVDEEKSCAPPGRWSSGPDQPRLDLHQHRRRLAGRRAVAEFNAHSGATRSSPT